MKTLIPLLFTIMVLVGCNNDSPTLTPPPASSTDTSEQVGWAWLDGRSTDAPLFTNDDDVVRKNYYIVFDGSGSMAGNRYRVAAAATVEFVKMLDDNVAIGMNAFDRNGTSERVSISTNNKSQVINAVNDLNINGGTPLNRAVVMAYNQLRYQALRQRGYGEYHIIIVTDGEANHGEDPRNSVATIVGTSPVQVHTIGFKLDHRHSLNQPGITNYYPADDYDGIMRGFSSILAESETFDDTTFN